MKLALIACATAWLAIGCGGAPKSLGSYDTCVRDGEPDQVRTGSIADHGGFVDWHPKSQRPAFTITETRRDCLLSVEARAADGTTLEGGPYRWVLYDRARRDPPRLVYTAGLPQAGFVVVVNGRPSARYDDLLFKPTISPNGKHVGFIARSGETEIVVVDGEEQLRHSRIERRLNASPRQSWFEVLDDGRSLVFAEESGKVRAYLGGDPVEPLLDLVSDTRGRSSPAGHYAFNARVGGRWTTVVDGVVVEHPGAAGRIAWSADGEEFAFVVRDAQPAQAGQASTPADGYVLNGVYTSLAKTSGINHHSGHWLVTTRHPNTITVLGVSAPEVPATTDDYRPAGSKARNATRVHIGDSIGPVFDSIEPRSIVVAEGRVRYRGRRGNQTLSVVDNVISDGSKSLQIAEPTQIAEPAQIAE